MFGGTTSTEYEDIVNKTTDENLTSENWELILNLCDKVQDEGQSGAHAAIAAILKRLAHRNPNVQLYALSLTESLSKNLGIEIHRELASRAFTQGLEKLITDRNTHEKVRRRALGLIALWTAEFEKDETLGIMEECYNNLKAKNYKFEQPQEAPPPTVDDDIRRKEEEELQRVLEMSMQDKGGRNQWSQYSLASGSSSSAAPASGGSATLASTSTPSGSSPAHPFSAPKYSGGGYVPARTPSPATVAAQQRQQAQHYQQAQAQHKHSSSVAPIAEPVTPTVTVSPDIPAAAPTASGSAMAASGNIVTRVRALHTFEPTEPGELAFEKGDVIKVVDRGYKDWWRGQLKGRTGIFPVNYVEAMPEPTAAELAKEAEQEAAVFAQAVNVEKLLNMLRAMDPTKDNLADNEEIQELYRSSMALRPKIVKLIDKYSQKRADLVSMNETFVRARTIFDRMMEESLARHTGVYDQAPTFRVPQYGQQAQGRPDSRGPAGRRPEYGPGGPPQGYGWNAPAAGYEQPGYGAYGASNAYPGPMPGGQQPGQDMGVSPYPTPGPGPGQPQQQQQQQQQPQQGYVDPAAAAVYGGGVMSPLGQPQQVPGSYGVVPQGGYAGHQPGAPYTQQGPTPYPAQQPQQQQQQQPAQQPIQQQQQQPIQQQPIQQQPSQQQPTAHQPIQQQPQQVAQQPQQFAQQPQQVAQQLQQQHLVQIQPEVQSATSPASAISPQPQVQQSQPHIEPQQQEPQPQPQPQPQVQAQPISGPPPYAYDPSYTYADPNVQAWAQYYAQGGKDLAGSVYFISIPGVTDARTTSPQPQPQPEGYGAHHHQQQQQQQQPQQALGRQQSLQAQAQAQPHVQPQATESDLAYAANPSISYRAASPTQQQTQQQPISYQLHDQPMPQQIEPQYANQYQQPQAAHDAAHQQASPSSPSYGGSTGPGSASPTQTSTVPSWVLPKKTGPGGGSASSLHGRDDSYFPLTGQMGGLTMTDPGSGSAVSG